MTIYEYIVEEARQHGTTIHFDLKNHDIRIGKHYILKDGKPTTNTFDGLIEFEGDPYAEIERLYAQFKRSVPNRHEKLNRGYFKALSSDALTMDELINNKPRIEARYELEGFIVLASSAGLIPWNNPKHFFWQSHTDPDCIIYKEWII